MTTITLPPEIEGPLVEEAQEAGHDPGVACPGKLTSTICLLTHQGTDQGANAFRISSLAARLERLTERTKRFRKIVASVFPRGWLSDGSGSAHDVDRYPGRLC